MKRCSKCGEEKAPTEFGKRGSGISTRCKPCTNAYNREARKKGVGPKATHGRHATYVRGCRCEPCCDAHREYKRKWRVSGSPGAQHDADYRRKADRAKRRVLRQLALAHPDEYWLLFRQEMAK